MSEEDRQNITYRRQRYWSREKELEITPDTKDRGKAVEDMGEPKSKEEIAFDNLLKALSDLAKGQKEMLDEIKRQNREWSTYRQFVFGETSGASQQFDHLSPIAQSPPSSEPTQATLPSFLPLVQGEIGGGEDPSLMGEHFKE